MGKSDNSSMKVLYIMGAGHVGSTILDLAISSNPQMESLGEVSKFHRYGWTPDENRKCACGQSVFECPFWSQVRQRWIDLIGRNDVVRYLFLQSRFERSHSGWGRLLWNSFFRTSEFIEYMQRTEALYSSIHFVGNKNLLVDSSLTPKRAYALTMNPNIDLHLIHLVRDGRGVIWSLMKPGKKTLTKEYVPAPPERTTRYWILANLQSAWVFRRVREEKRKLIRYEDFVTDPSMVLQEIGALLGEDLSGLVSGSSLTNPSQIRHTVGGNRVRMQKDIYIKPDFAWMEHLSEKDSRMFWRKAGWLARRFGYLEHQSDYR